MVTPFSVEVHAESTKAAKAASIKAKSFMLRVNIYTFIVFKFFLNGKEFA